LPDGLLLFVFGAAALGFVAARRRGARVMKSLQLRQTNGMWP
jgi:UPF0716 family protein affecting phage T7 exclusion